MPKVIFQVPSQLATLGQYLTSIDKPNLYWFLRFNINTGYVRLRISTVNNPSKKEILQEASRDTTIYDFAQMVAFNFHSVVIDENNISPSRA